MRSLSILAVAAAVLPSALGPPALQAQSSEELIQNAVRAAPRSVSAEATIVDGEQNVLRQGSNRWTCLPDDPDMQGDSPMCIDQPWLAFLEAFLGGQEAPDYDGIGFGYMLRGDFPVSNRDPFATGPTEDNEWIEDSGPHVMMLVSDLELLEGLPTSPGEGPWVMWEGTPYAHVMIPVPGMPRH